MFECGCRVLPVALAAGNVRFNCYLIVFRVVTTWNFMHSHVLLVRFADFVFMFEMTLRV